MKKNQKILQENLIRLHLIIIFLQMMKFRTKAILNYHPKKRVALFLQGLRNALARVSKVVLVKTIPFQMHQMRIAKICRPYPSNFLIHCDNISRMITLMLIKRENLPKYQLSQISSQCWKTLYAIMVSLNVL